MKTIPRMLVDQYIRCDGILQALRALSRNVGADKRPKPKGQLSKDEVENRREQKAQLREAVQTRDDAAFAIYESLDETQLTITEFSTGEREVNDFFHRAGDIAGGGRVVVELKRHPSGHAEYLVTLRP